MGGEVSVLKNAFLVCVIKNDDEDERGRYGNEMYIWFSASAAARCDGESDRSATRVKT